MEQQIATLLHTTFAGQNDQEISDAFNMLLQNMSNPSFFPSLFNVIFNQSVPIEIRKAGINLLKQSTIMFWYKEDSPITNEIKQLIFQFIPQLLKNSSVDLLSMSSDLATNIINLTFLNNEWPEAYTIFMNGFSDNPGNTENDLICSLILGHSLCTVFNRYENPNEEIIGQFLQFVATKLIPGIYAIIHNKNNLHMITLSYQIFNQLISFQEPFLNQLLNPEGHIGNNIFAILLQEFVQYSFHINQYSPETPFYRQFIEEMITFLAVCYRNHLLAPFLDIGFIHTFLPIIPQLLNSALPNSIRCRALDFLSSIILNSNIWSTFEEEQIARNLIEFITQLFEVTEDDFQLACTDPASFLNENQKMIEDFNDLKSSASYILYMVAEKHPIIVPAVLSLADTSFKSFSNGTENSLTLFSHFHMCSNVLNMMKNNETVLSLFQNISPLFQICADENDHHRQFATAAGFWLLASCTNLDYPKEMIDVVFAHLDNPFILTRYLAIECLSSIFRSISHKSELKQVIFDTYGEKLYQSLQFLLAFSSESKNLNLTESFIHYFSLFGEKLLPMAEDFSQYFINMLNELTEDRSNFCSLILAINSFSSLLDIIFKSEENSIRLCPMIYKSLVELLPRIPSNAINTYFSLFIQIVNDGPLFTPEYWSITESINFDYIREYCALFEFLQLKDLEMGTGAAPSIEFMVNFIGQTLNLVSLDDFKLYCPAIVGFVLRTGTNFVQINGGDLFRQTAQKVFTCIEMYCSNPDAWISKSVLALLNALFVVDANSTMALCNQGILDVWKRHLIYPISIPAAVNIIQIIADIDQKCELLAIVLDLVYLHLIFKSISKVKLCGECEDEYDDDFEIFDDDSDYDDDFEEPTKACRWYTENHILQFIKPLYQAYEPGNPLFARCDPQKFEALMSYQHHKNLILQISAEGP